MPLTTKNWKWHETAKAGHVCAKGSVRVVKPRAGWLVRICCPKAKWKNGRCKVGMRSIAVGKRRGSRFGEASISVPKSHLRKDISEAKAMIRELKSGVKRDQAALKRRR